MSELTLKSVIDLLDKNYFIPSYQRGYRWEKRQVWDMLEDLYKFAKDSEYIQRMLVKIEKINRIGFC